MTEELKACPFCGKSDIHIEQKGTFFWCECYDCGAISREHHTLPGVNVLQSEDIASGYWNTRPIEDALLKRAERAEAMVERLMRMVEDRFVLVGNSLDGHLQDCNCAVFLSSRMERDAWSELSYEWHGIYSDWQSVNGHQAGNVSENEGSEG
jgi:hypothetical protein